MKKIILFIIFTIISTTIFSQTKQGQIQLGGSFNMNISFDISSSSKGFSLNPAIHGGYFIKDNLMLRGEMKAVVFSINNNLDEFIWGIGVGGGTRFYFRREKLQPFIGTYAYFARNQLGQSGDRLSHLDFTLDTGISYFIKDNIAIEFSFPVDYYINFHRQNGELEVFYNPSWSGEPSFGFQVYL